MWNTRVAKVATNRVRKDASEAARISGNIDPFPTADANCPFSVSLGRTDIIDYGSGSPEPSSSTAKRRRTHESPCIPRYRPRANIFQPLRESVEKEQLFDFINRVAEAILAFENDDVSHRRAFLFRIAYPEREL